MMRALLYMLAMGASLAAIGFAWTARPAFRYQAGLRALARNDLEAAQREAATLAEADGYAPHAHLLTGAVCLRSGRMQQALDELALAGLHRDTHLPAMLLAGECLYRGSRLREAEKTLSAVLVIDPNNLEAHRWLACLYTDIGARLHAVRHWRRVADLAPDDGRPHRMLGMIYMDFKDYSGAARNYTESLRRAPAPHDLEEVLLELAESQVKSRQYAAALDTLARSAPSADRFTWEAECHYGEGRSTEARNAVERALGLSASHRQALWLKGRMELESGNAAEAARVLAQAVAAHPNDYFVRFKLAQAYRTLGRKVLADEQQRLAQQIKLLRQRLRKMMHEAVERPMDAEIRYQIGLVARQLDEPADGWFEVAAAIDPNHDLARQELLRERAPETALTTGDSL